ncbi:hypothetical protein XVE_1478 [Xanthomonas vesicatoria ATCC 35937]|uniref:Uncharacterized protein n=1 Tax=Xanthomonas vesicatoria ATCC 35937 TaxID=925775 RepID=F0BBK6_9XANT|nr:hypothetical protein XVE_1478 [Xanthomonas vesicatoria ATCC 35937]
MIKAHSLTETSVAIACIQCMDVIDSALKRDESAATAVQVR